MKSFAIASIVTLLAATANVVNAAPTYTNDFSSPLTLSATKAPGAWYVDRYAPAGFQTSGGELVQTLSAADGPSARPAPYNINFYSTQGRQYDLPSVVPNTTQTVSIDLFVPSSWTADNTINANKRSVGLWGQATDADGVVTAFPTLRFVNDSAVSPIAGFYGFDTNTGANILSTAPINYDAFNTLTFTVTPGVGTSYYINGTLVSVSADLASVAVPTVLLEAKNFDADYSARWDNLTATVPEPTSLAVIGVATVIALHRRRRHA